MIRPQQRRTLALPPLRDHCSGIGLDVDVNRYILSTVSSPDVVEHAFDQGLRTFLVCADLHWAHYQSTRTGLQRLLRERPIRDQLVVMAMSYVAQPNAPMSAFRELLDAVPELERLDLVIMGGVDDRTFLPQLEHYRAYVDGGRLGSPRIGASFEKYRTALMSIDARAVDVAFIPFSVGHRPDEAAISQFQPRVGSPPLYAIASAFPYRTENQLAQVGLPSSMWRPSQSDYYRYALTWAAFDGVILSSASVGALNELAAAIEMGPLDDEELQYLADLDDLVNGRARLAEDDAVPVDPTAPPRRES